MSLLIMICLLTIAPYRYISTRIAPTFRSGLINVNSDVMSVSVLKEFNKNLVIARVLQINNETVTLEGTNAWQNETWNDTQGNLKSFNAEWAKIGAKYSFNNSYWTEIEINSEAGSEYWNKNYVLFFMSRYNGTQFTQAILVLNTTSNFTYEIMADHIQDDNYDYVTSEISKFSGGIEINRTTYFGNTTSSIYNPAHALYNAILAMKAHNYTFMSVTHIFLIPHEFIPNEFNITAKFLWYIKFVYDEPPLHNTTPPIGVVYYTYRAVVFPNGTLLRLDKRGGPVVFPCGNCEEEQHTNVFYVVGIAIVVIVLIPITFLALWRRRRHKKLFQNSIQS